MYLLPAPAKGIRLKKLMGKFFSLALPFVQEGSISIWDQFREETRRRERVSKRHGTPSKRNCLNDHARLLFNSDALLSESFLPLTNGYDLVRNTKSAWKWHVSLNIWVMKSVHFVLPSAFYFSFMKVYNEISEFKERKALRSSKKQNADFIKINGRSCCILKVGPQNVDDLSFQEPHRKREVGSRRGDWKTLKVPREVWLVPGRIEVFMLVSVLFVVMVSMVLILLKKEKWISEWAWTTSTLIGIK